MATRLSYSSLPDGKEAAMESRYDPTYGRETADLIGEGISVSDYIELQKNEGKKKNLSHHTAT
jgi:hypothetical protein